MQTDKARESLRHITSMILLEGMLHGYTSKLRKRVLELRELCEQSLDALESVKAIGILESHGVEIVELDTAPEEAYPCQSYLRNEPQEWVRQNNADGAK